MALRKWLGGEGVDRPRRLDAPPADPGGLATVTAAIDSGAILLSGPGGLVNLVWTGDDGPKERALPAGAFEVRWLRLEKAGEDSLFMLSATGVKGDPLVLEAGKAAAIPVDARIAFKGRARRVHGELRLGFALTDPAGRGLSVYEDGHRVEVRYELLGEDGAVLAAGSADYG